MVQKYDYKLNNEEETLALAVKLGQNLFAGAVITLAGELGAGKTTFTKGIARGLGVEDHVNSPTFTIIKEYEGDLKLNHIDAYRIENSQEDLGLDEYFYGQGVTVVEWASKIHEQLPKEHLHISLYNMGGTVRILEAFPKSEAYVKVCEAVFND
jgi:tRNA threonylcarbamoyladenosine biosynthesis protein TsaE